MTINIKLKQPNVFNPGGIFEGIPPNRAVLHLGVARDDTYIGKINQGNASNLSYRGGQTNFQVDTRGTDMSDEMFEYFVTNQGYQTSYLTHIVHFVELGVIEVTQDGGVALTAAQIRAFKV